MNLLKYIPFFILPIITPTIMAEPAADPNPNANPDPTYNIAESAPMLTHLLTRRDSDLAGLLNSISTVINGIEKLANAQTLDKLATIIDGAATLLGGDEPEKLVNVVNNAQALLTPRFVNETAVIIDDVFPLVSSLSHLAQAL